MLSLLRTQCMNEIIKNEEPDIDPRQLGGFDRSSWENFSTDFSVLVCYIMRENGTILEDFLKAIQQYENSSSTTNDDLIKLYIYLIEKLSNTKSSDEYHLLFNKNNIDYLLSDKSLDDKLKVYNEVQKRLDKDAQQSLEQLKKSFESFEKQLIEQMNKNPNERNFIKISEDFVTFEKQWNVLYEEHQFFPSETFKALDKLKTSIINLLKTNKIEVMFFTTTQEGKGLSSSEVKSAQDLKLNTFSKKGIALTGIAEYLEKNTLFMMVLNKVSIVADNIVHGNAKTDLAGTIDRMLPCLSNTNLTPNLNKVTILACNTAKELSKERIKNASSSSDLYFVKDDIKNFKTPEIKNPYKKIYICVVDIQYNPAMATLYLLRKNEWAIIKKNIPIDDQSDRKKIENSIRTREKDQCQLAPKINTFKSRFMLDLHQIIYEDSKNPFVNGKMNLYLKVLSNDTNVREELNKYKEGVISDSDKKRLKHKMPGIGNITFFQMDQENELRPAEVVAKHLNDHRGPKYPVDVKGYVVPVTPNREKDATYIKGAGDIGKSVTYVYKK